MEFRQELQGRIVQFGWVPLNRRQLINQAEYNAFLQKQFEEMLKAYTQRAEKIDGLLRTLAKEDGSVVLNQLSDPEPFNRWLAVLVVAKKRMAAEEYLIDLLADKHPAVREAAYQALKRIGRSTDFGPPPKANTKQIARAQEQWRGWLQTQVETRLAETPSKSNTPK